MVMWCLDQAEIESPKRFQVTCALPECGTLVAYPDIWKLQVKYRALEDHWETRTMIAHCCSQACAHALARYVGADEVKVIDWDLLARLPLPAE